MTKKVLNLEGGLSKKITIKKTRMMKIDKTQHSYISNSNFFFCNFASQNNL